MAAPDVQISMTRFVDFVASDPPGQAAKIRDIYRQYQSDYIPSEDFWSRFRDDLADVHRSGDRSRLSLVGATAAANRTGR